MSKFNNIPDTLEMIANKAAMYFEERMLKLSDNKFYDAIWRSEEDYEEVNEFFLQETISTTLMNKDIEFDIEEFFNEHMEARLYRLLDKTLEILKLCDENTKLQFEALSYNYPYPSKIVTDENTGVSLRATHGTIFGSQHKKNPESALVLEFKINLVKKSMGDNQND